LLDPTCAIDPEVIARLVGRRKADAPLENCTRQELDVLALMAEGRSDAEIPEKLGVSDEAGPGGRHRGVLEAWLGS
jgi:DNA-binding NarL/FixJ family response regulator